MNYPSFFRQSISIIVIGLIVHIGLMAQGNIELPEDLQVVLDDYTQAWEAKSASQLASLFTEDGYILRPGHVHVSGRTAIEESYKNVGGPLFLRAYDYSVQGDLAYIIGGYARASDLEDVGKYTLILKRVEGKWLIHSDMDNHNG